MISRFLASVFALSQLVFLHVFGSLTLENIIYQPFSLIQQAPISNRVAFQHNYNFKAVLPLGGKMRKEILDSGTLNSRSATTGELDIVNIATVQLTSEDAEHPIENAFNQQQGGSYWAAATSGSQTITLVFDQPQVIRKIQLEIEELEASRTQVLQISVSRNGGESFEKVIEQDYTFSPPGTTLQREDWTVNLEQVTHFRLNIQPDRDHNLAIAKLSSLILSSEN